MPRIRLASAALLLALTAGTGVAVVHTAADAPSHSSVATAEDDSPTAPSTGDPDDMYWD